MAKSEKGSRTTMTFRERAKLAALVMDGYASSGLDDAAFAKLAAERLGLPVSPYNVVNVRKSMDIPNNEMVRRADAARKRAALAASIAERSDHAALVQTIGVLSEAVAALSARVRKLEEAWRQPQLFGLPVLDVPPSMAKGVQA